MTLYLIFLTHRERRKVSLSCYPIRRSSAPLLLPPQRWRRSKALPWRWPWARPDPTWPPAQLEPMAVAVRLPQPNWIPLHQPSGPLTPPTARAPPTRAPCPSPLPRANPAHHCTRCMTLGQSSARGTTLPLSPCRAPNVLSFPTGYFSVHVDWSCRVELISPHVKG